jgi:competence protein ComGC
MSINNDRGYVLINVLAILILVMAFAMLLIPKTLNTATQVNKSERNTQVKDLSEMGIKYAHAYLQSLVTGAINDTISNPTTKKYPNITNQDTLFCLNLRERLKNQYSKENKHGDDASYSYKIDYLGKYFISSTNNENYTISSTTTYDCVGFKGVKVPISSVGKKGSAEKTINAEFVIENKGEEGNQFVPGTGYTERLYPTDITFSQTYTQDPKLSGQDRLNVPVSAYFGNRVTISGNGKLYVSGHAWFDGKSYPSVDLNGNVIIMAISGNAYFRNGIDFKTSNYICIRGLGYLWNETKNDWEPYPKVHTEAACPPTLEKTIEYTNDVNEWGIIEGELNVIY